MCKKQMTNDRNIKKENEEGMTPAVSSAPPVSIHPSPPKPDTHHFPLSGRPNQRDDSAREKVHISSPFFFFNNNKTQVKSKTRSVCVCVDQEKSRKTSPFFQRHVNNAHKSGQPPDFLFTAAAAARARKKSVFPRVTQYINTRWYGFKMRVVMRRGREKTKKVLSDSE